jgi:hypothetical protein
MATQSTDEQMAGRSNVESKERGPLLMCREMFKLGSLFAKLFYWLEVAWFDDETGEDSPAFGRVAIKVDEISGFAELLETKWGDGPAIKSISEFGLKTRRFFSIYKQAWLGEPRAKMSGRFAHADREFAADFQKLELSDKHSPFSRPQFADLKQAHSDLQQSLTPEAYASFALGRRLQCTTHPLIMGGTVELDLAARQAYFATQFNNELRLHMEKLTETFPFFQALDYDLSDCAGTAIDQSIGRTYQTIATWLVRPPATPGYLGLILDRSNNRIVRGKQTINLKGDLVWAVLIKLMQSGPEITPRNALNAVLDDRRTKRGQLHRKAISSNSYYEQGSLDQHLRILRGALRPLGVSVPAARGQGWKLVDSKDEPATLRKRRKATRKRK